MWEGLATDYQYFKFFRFRSPVNVFLFAGEHQSDIFWLAGAIKYIDFNKEIFIKEAVLIMNYTKGGVSIEYLETTPFDRYELLLEEAIRIQKIEENTSDIGEA